MKTKEINRFSEIIIKNKNIRHNLIKNPDFLLFYTPSMSRRGNCLDNSLAENFFSIIKTECIYGVKLDSFEQANSLIDDYIYFYNNQRLQLKTKLTPLEQRNQFAN